MRRPTGEEMNVKPKRPEYICEAGHRFRSPVTQRPRCPHVLKGIKGTMEICKRLATPANP